MLFLISFTNKDVINLVLEYFFLIFNIPIITTIFGKFQLSFSWIFPECYIGKLENLTINNIQCF